MPSPSRRQHRAFAAGLLLGAGLVAGGSAWAGDLRMTVEKPRFTCERGGVSLSHVAFHGSRPRLAEAVLPCCDGRLGCAQFLSTNTVVLPQQRWRS